MLRCAGLIPFGTDAFFFCAIFVADFLSSLSVAAPLDFPLDTGGISHHVFPMPTATIKPPGSRKEITVLQDYDVSADAKNRISLRGAKVKYFHVLALSDGGYLLQPRVLVPPDAIPARTLKMLDRSVSQLKQGRASAPIDLTSFLKE